MLLTFKVHVWDRFSYYPYYPRQSCLIARKIESVSAVRCSSFTSCASCKFHWQRVKSLKWTWISLNRACMQGKKKNLSLQTSAGIAAEKMSGPSDTYAFLWCGSFWKVCWAPQCQCCWLPGLWTRTPPRDSTWWRWLTAASPRAAQELRDITEITFHQRHLPSFARSAGWKLALLLMCYLLPFPASDVSKGITAWIFFFLCPLVTYTKAAFFWGVCGIGKSPKKIEKIKIPASCLLVTRCSACDKVLLLHHSRWDVGRN